MSNKLTEPSSEPVISLRSGRRQDTYTVRV